MQSKVIDSLWAINFFPIIKTNKSLSFLEVRFDFQNIRKRNANETKKTELDFD